MVELTIRPEMTMERVDLWQTHIGTRPPDECPEGYEAMSAWEPVTFVAMWDRSYDDLSPVQHWAWRRPLAITEAEQERRRQVRQDEIAEANRKHAEEQEAHRARAFEWLMWDPWELKQEQLRCLADHVGVQWTTTMRKGEIAQAVFDVAWEATESSEAQPTNAGMR
jgi:hypothetical protein